MDKREQKKKTIVLAAMIIIFAIYSYIVLSEPEITLYDTAAIAHIQKQLAELPASIPIAAGGILFYIMTAFPVFAAGLYFIAKKRYNDMLIFASIPFVSYFLCSIVKKLAARPRPPIVFQIEEHMSSSSYFSRHTFITACLWGVFIYIVLKYCKNKPLKYILIVLSVFWIVFEGFSRVWLGVHYPSDVIGAYAAACIFIFILLCCCRFFQQRSIL